MPHPVLTEFYSSASSCQHLERDRQPSVCWVLPDIGFYHHARIDHFARRGQARVIVLEVSDTSRFQQFKKPRSGEESYKTVTLFRGRHYEQIAKRELSSAITRALNRVQPDTLLVQGWGLSYSLAAHDWAAANHVPVVLTCESTRHDHRRVRFREWVKSRVVGLCSSALVGGHPHAEYVARLGMPAERIFPGYDIIDNSHFRDGAERARQESVQLRAAHRLPENYFLASTRFVAKKNLPRLLHAFARFRELSASNTANRDRPRGKTEKRELGTCSWSLVLLGDGPLRDSLVELCSTLKLQNHVLMPGLKCYEELVVFYGLAGAFIHASTTEQWGLVVNEAMASGLPVLVSDRCGCSRDLVQTGANGFTFDPYDIEELARLMLRMATMEIPLRAKLALHSRRIIGRWGPERFARGLKRAVDCALSARPTPACLFDRMLLRLLIMRT